MFWLVVCTFLAAAGLIFLCWALLGWCVLPQRQSAVTVYDLSGPEPQLEQQVQAFVWTKRSGLQAGELYLVGGEDAPQTQTLARRLAAQYACVRYYTREEWQEREAWNRKHR